MHQMSMSRTRLYAPFLALVAFQALLVALLPSTSGADQASFADGAAATGNGTAQASAPGAGDAGGPGLTDLDTAGGDGAGSGGTTAATQGNGQGGASTDGAGDGGANGEGGSDGDVGSDTGGVAAAGDSSHCTEDGRQHGVTFHAPECRPVFEGDNGGAT
jgi:hypothetical protein